MAETLPSHDERLPPYLQFTISLIPLFLSTLEMDTGTEDAFIHQLAIKLSRELNLVNPNDLLARRVQDIAKTNPLQSFVSGKHVPVTIIFIVCVTNTIPAAKSFGKFRDSFLAEIHAEISSHAKQEAAGLVPKPVQGIVVHDSEVLEPEPVRAGGLVRSDAVCAHSF